MDKDKPVENNPNLANTEDTTTNVSSASTSQNNDNVLLQTLNKKSETAKTIQDYLFKSFYNRRGDQIKQKYEFWDTQPVPKITTKEITVRIQLFYSQQVQLTLIMMLRAKDRNHLNYPKDSSGMMQI